MKLLLSPLPFCLFALTVSMANQGIAMPVPSDDEGYSSPPRNLSYHVNRGQSVQVRTQYGNVKSKKDTVFTTDIMGRQGANVNIGSQAQTFDGHAGDISTSQTFASQRMHSSRSHNSYSRQRGN